MKRAVRRVGSVALVLVVSVACAALSIRSLVPRGTLYVQVAPHATSTLALVEVRAVEADGELVPLNCVAPENNETRLLVCTKRLRPGTYPDIELAWEASNADTLPYPITRAPLQYTLVEDATTAILIGVDTERSTIALSSGGEVLLPFVSIEVREGARVEVTGEVSGGTVLHSVSMGTDRFGVLRQNVRTSDFSLGKDEGGRLLPVTPDETPPGEAPASTVENEPVRGGESIATTTVEGGGATDTGTSFASTTPSDAPIDIH